MQHIIQRPVITEKSLTQATHGWYTFAVAKSARKETIAQAVSSSYNVTVTEVRTRNVHGKVRRVGRKMTKVIKQDWKKAIVKLKEGQHIDAFEVTPPQESNTRHPERSRSAGESKDPVKKEKK